MIVPNRERRSKHLLLIAATSLVLLASLLLDVPARHRRAVESFLARAGPDRLAVEAEQLWETNGGPDGKFQPIPGEDWPDAVRVFRPREVYVGPRGVTLQTRSSFVEGSGLFYLPRRSRYSPPPRGDPSFRPIRNGFYFYDIKG